MSNLILPDSCKQSQRPTNVDIFELPDGAHISGATFNRVQNALRNNPEFRERLEKLDRMTGRVSQHMAVFKGFYKQNESAIVYNQNKAEKIMLKRSKEERLKRSLQGHEKAYNS